MTWADHWGVIGVIKQMKKIGNATLYCADCNDVLPILKDIDACVTDPPYGLSFMGKQWDYDVPGVDIWTQVHNVLKPGAHLLSFFGSRTYHRGAIPIEDAGFEIRDQLMWIYGSGFPKSHNIGKAVDKLQGNEREVVGKNLNSRSAELHKKTVYESGLKDNAVITKGNSEWEGWGTALKPAHEPIVMARKPFKGSVAENVLEHGTGGINIDECRVGTDDKLSIGSNKRDNANVNFGMKDNKEKQKQHEQGRFPANVMHDGSEEVQKIFPQTSKSSGGRSYQNTNQMYSGGWANEKGNKTDPGFGDEGTAARYFYCAKASKKDRDEGLEQLETPTENLQGLDTRGRTLVRDDGTKTLVERWKPSAERKNNHPTVKPTELMRYLCRLVTPQGGVVLDPFMGSGSTGKAAVMGGYEFVGIEMDEDYFEIACARLQAAQKQRGLF
jgi:site-specific DNA-methyltransferase (adenine-specific)